VPSLSWRQHPTRAPRLASAALASVDCRATSTAVHLLVMEDQHQRSAHLVRITVALTPSLIDRLDERRRQAPDLLDRGAMIRRLLEKALSSEEEERGRERGAAGHDSQHKNPHANADTA
jgi:hypothetical protein